MPETLHDFFRRLALFADFNERELDDFLRLSNRLRLNTNDVLCREGDEGHSMYIIREGVVRVERDAGNGQPLTLARLSEGMVVGEMALVDEAPRSASLVAESEGIVYEFRRRDFEALRDGMHPAPYKLMRAISLDCCERLRRVNGQIEDFIHNPASLFAPDIRSDAQPEAGVAGRVKSFLKRFGNRT
jgi:CRP-like cAMP-binding protein